MKLSIIIVNYNVYPQLKNCLKSIYEIKPLFGFEIIVADNCSPERDIENILIDFPAVKYLRLPGNFGFARANNIAAGSSVGEYILFLNPDTLIVEDFLTPIVDLLDNNNNNIGACSPALIYNNKKKQHSFGFRFGILYDLTESLFILPVLRYINALYLRIVNCSFCRTGWVSGACLFVKKKIFLESKGFDSNIFLNYEDIDLCRTFEDLGYKNYYLPQYSCIHLDHKSFDRDFSKLVFTRYQSKLYLTSKYYNGFESFISRIINICGIVIRYILTFVLFFETSAVERRKGYKKSLLLYLNGS